MQAIYVIIPHHQVKFTRDSCSIARGMFQVLDKEMIKDPSETISCIKVVIHSIILKLHSEKIIVLTLDKHFKDTDCGGYTSGYHKMVHGPHHPRRPGP